MMCYLCGKVPVKPTRDHVVPRKLVPKAMRRVFYNRKDAIKMVCRSCNQMKHSLTLEEFIEKVRVIFFYQYQEMQKVESNPENVQPVYKAA